VAFSAAVARVGVSISGRPATGYRLLAVPDLLLPDVLSPLVQGTIFDNQIITITRLGQRNSVAMEAANAGVPQGSVFLAERQTAGRDVARTAGTPPSRRDLLLGRAAASTAALGGADSFPGCGLAVHAAIQAMISRVAVDLKWPNDLLINGKKIAGILTEMNSEVTRVRYIVVGSESTSTKRLSRGTAADRDFPVSGYGNRMVARGTVRGLLKSLNANIVICWKSLERMMQSSGVSKQQSSSSRGRQVQVEENGGFEGVTGGTRPARVPAGSDGAWSPHSLE